MQRHRPVGCPGDAKNSHVVPSPDNETGDNKVLHKLKGPKEPILRSFGSSGVPCMELSPPTAGLKARLGLPGGSSELLVFLVIVVEASILHGFTCSEM